MIRIARSELERGVDEAGDLVFYTSYEAANLLEVSTVTISSWRKAGFLRALPWGRGFVYTMPAITEAARIKGYEITKKGG
mgnify:CR=1 FL=1